MTNHQKWEIRHTKNGPVNRFNEPLILCRRKCGTYTTMLGTGLCDNCWELEHRIKANPQLARQILDEVDGTDGSG